MTARKPAPKTARKPAAGRKTEKGAPAELAPAAKAASKASDGAVMLEPRTDLFLDDALAALERRALGYLEAGAPVHFRGPAGAGKTTLACHLAARLGRPVILLTGDAWLTASHLVGDVVGSKTNHVHDRFIHSVTKTRTESSELWEDRALTIAMQKGYTFVYDEFTRSSPEANNPLLAALEERMLPLPSRAGRDRLIRAHDDFRAILTSNPDDYAAVKAPQDALMDRMITFDLVWHGVETEIGVVCARTGIDAERARPIVMLVRALRDGPAVARAPSMRTAITLARIVRHQDLSPSAEDPRFLQLCIDVLESRAPINEDRRAERAAFLDALTTRIRAIGAEAGGAETIAPPRADSRTLMGAVA